MVSPAGRALCSQIIMQMLGAPRMSIQRYVDRRYKISWYSTSKESPVILYSSNKLLDLMCLQWKENSLSKGKICKNLYGHLKNFYIHERRKNEYKKMEPKSKTEHWLPKEPDISSQKKNNLQSIIYLLPKKIKFFKGNKTLGKCLQRLNKY